MSTTAELAGRLATTLDLDIVPVALSFVAEPPAGVPETAGAVPSSCAFWRHAESGVFFAAAGAHFNCQVGAMVMGFDLPPEVSAELGGLVESMCAQEYLHPDEAARIPTVPGNPAGIVYGPLAELPTSPDVVLLWLTASQAMLANEATGGASWTSEPTRVGGRPACAALPLALSDGRPTLSLGCIGMRTFTEIPADRLLAAVPGERLADFVDRLERMATANSSMAAFYQERRAAVLA